MAQSLGDFVSGEIYKSKERTAILEHNAIMQKNIEILITAKKWVEAKDGELIGHGPFYVFLESLTLGDGYMGFGGGGRMVMEFPSGHISSIFGEPKSCGSLALTPELIDAFISLFTQSIKAVPNDQ